MNAAFLGLGNMGLPMALNLAKGVDCVHAFDIKKERIKALKDQAPAGKIKEAANIQEALDGVDYLFTSLPGPKQIEASSSTIFENLEPGVVWIELSTSDLSVHQKLTQKAQNHGVHLLDAPVTGGSEGAQEGSLLLLVGGDKAVYERSLYLLQCIGKQALYIGSHGAGYVAKVAQVLLCYLNSVALSEALMLGAKNGIDPDVMLLIIQNSAGSSYAAHRYGPNILSGDYDPSFALGLAHKDMCLAKDMARQSNALLPMTNQVEGIYAEAKRRYGEHQNHLMAVKILEEKNQTPLRSNPSKKPI